MRLTGVHLGVQGPMEKMALAAPPIPPASQATCATGPAPSRHPCTPHPRMPSSAKRSWTLPPGQVRPTLHQLLHLIHLKTHRKHSINYGQMWLWIPKSQ